MKEKDLHVNGVAQSCRDAPSTSQRKEKIPLEQCLETSVLDYMHQSSTPTELRQLQAS